MLLIEGKWGKVGLWLVGMVKSEVVEAGRIGSGEELDYVDQLADGGEPVRGVVGMAEKGFVRQVLVWEQGSVGEKGHGIGKRWGLLREEAGQPCLEGTMPADVNEGDRRAVLVEELVEVLEERGAFGGSGLEDFGFAFFEIGEELGFGEGLVWVRGKGIVGKAEATGNGVGREVAKAGGEEGGSGFIETGESSDLEGAAGEENVMGRPCAERIGCADLPDLVEDGSVAGKKPKLLGGLVVQAVDQPINHAAEQGAADGVATGFDGIVVGGGCFHDDGEGNLSRKAEAKAFLEKFFWTVF